MSSFGKHSVLVTECLPGTNARGEGSGRVANIPLSEGWALYEIESADYVEGRRPEVLVGRDASGREIASQRLPWATPGR